jgi:hypothetical protein
MEFNTLYVGGWVLDANGYGVEFKTLLVRCHHFRQDTMGPEWSSRLCRIGASDKFEDIFLFYDLILFVLFEPVLVLGALGPGGLSPGRNL